MRTTVTMLIGKVVRSLAKLRGGGSALPGLVVEKIDPGFLSRTLKQLPEGVIVISGTNGKTTTAKIVVELLEASGLRVFTNSTGSNFSRGVIAGIVQTANLRGSLPADIAVLELDEAHAIHFIAQVKPRFTLLLNVLRDQLDRFGEIDTTAGLLSQIADATNEGLVVNRDDELIRKIGERVSSKGSPPSVEVRSFGLSPELRKLFPSDAQLHGGLAPDMSLVDQQHADVTLVAVGDHEATFQMDGERISTSLALEGLYNTFNAAAALALVRIVLAATQVPNVHLLTSAELVQALSVIAPAFGRGERLTLDGQPLDLVLVKNPAGFRLALASFDAAGVQTMIAINDKDADGRDMSWLWDVSFDSLQDAGVDTVSGTRAWEMALRLQHDRVPFRAVIEPLSESLREFRDHTHGHPRRIFCTYTAMLSLRKELATLTEVENVW
jgi:UDP-N-acetylmuramyl tripeptide synthase